ncbi:uncharacterized protein LOC133376818 [Rhineura floridana]|uniref:uncharacterized protein LOC133376818 n=1 Tax=Rhineura floridana TaxID=261503 RepID=UPI002AC87B2B|nr:uncharacterized protein LOC133376818 [Rhineura floridana]
MSLNEEITETKSPSPKAGTKDLHQTIRAPAASQYSTCPLCLRTFGNMLYVNPCLHSFCFSCTQDLLETKAECPCCKKPFHSVFHPVNIKGCSKDLPSPRHPKGDSPSTKKHPKEEHVSSHSKKHMEKRPSLPSKSQSGEHITLPRLREEDLSRPNLKRPHRPSSFKSPGKDSPFLSGFTKHQARHECLHLSILGKVLNSDHISTEVVDETAFNSPPELMTPRDNEQDNIQYRAISANLSRPNFLEATLLIISSGAMLFICTYIYLSLVLLHK